MLKTSEASGYSQRLIGHMQSSCPSLLTRLGDQINHCGTVSDSVEGFRRELNRTLRSALASLPMNTMNIRIHLDDYDNIEFWRMNLTSIVFPFLEKNFYQLGLQWEAESPQLR
tara:strand:- start:127 stop:465 length:339 start_codon:yes stop_codon:yes gene_type:complete